MVIVPDAVSNSIVLGDPAEAAADVRKLIEEIDHRAMMVQIEVVLADVPVDKPARLQAGNREPRITGSTASPPGRVNSLTFENVGTVLALTPRVGPDRSVTLEIEVEDSRLGPREEGAAVATTPEGESARTPGVLAVRLAEAVEHHPLLAGHLPTGSVSLHTKPGNALEMLHVSRDHQLPLLQGHIGDQGVHV